MAFRKFFVTFLLMALAISLDAKVPPTVLNKGHFLMRYENDFFNANDWYYTQGTRFEFAAPFLQNSPLSKVIIGIRNATFRRDGIFFQHNGYTPTSISSDSILFGNHPFGCAMYLGENRLSLNSHNNSGVFSNITAGILGMTGACDEIQTIIHRATGNKIPIGWEFQLANDVILNYQVHYTKGLLHKSMAEFMVFGEARIGTMHDDAQLGIIGRFGKMRPFFAPSIRANERKFQLYLEGSAYAEAVCYNATMQGGMFSTSQYVLSSSEIERLIYGASLSLKVQFSRWIIEHYKTWRTAAFLNARNHGWGAIEIRMLF